VLIGNKLPPYILNRKAVPKENICKHLLVWAQKKFEDGIEVNWKIGLDVYVNVSLVHYQSRGV
jgi:hypothetical protein